MTLQRYSQQNSKCEKFCETNNLLYLSNKLQGVGERIERKGTIH